MTAAADWRRCRPWIEAALQTCPTHAIEDVEAGIETGALQFWAGDACAAITEIADYPRLRALHHWLSGGRLKALMTQRLAIEAWARAMGCQAIFGSSASPALGRILAPHGYVRGQTDYWKELS